METTEISEADIATYQELDERDRQISRILDAYHILNFPPEKKDTRMRIIRMDAVVKDRFGNDIIVKNPLLVAEGKDDKGKPKYVTRVRIDAWKHARGNIKLGTYESIVATEDKFDPQLERALELRIDEIPREEHNE